MHCLLIQQYKPRIITTRLRSVPAGKVTSGGTALARYRIRSRFTSASSSHHHQYPVMISAVCTLSQEAVGLGAGRYYVVWKQVSAECHVDYHYH